MLTKKRLDEVLVYSASTGVFTWKMARGRAPAGSIAGGPSGGGYLGVRVDGVRHLAHRLAWLSIYGDWPLGEIDHIDGNRRNNALLNLRDVPRNMNQQNQRKAQITNSTKNLGVSRSDSKSRFRARIFVNGRENNLGSFSTPEEAHEAYLKAKRNIHPGGTL